MIKEVMIPSSSPLPRKHRWQDVTIALGKQVVSMASLSCIVLMFDMTLKWCFTVLDEGDHSFATGRNASTLEKWMQGREDRRRQKDTQVLRS